MAHSNGLHCYGLHRYGLYSRVWDVWLSRACPMMLSAVHGHVCRHVCGYVCGHVDGHVYGPVYGHMYGHVSGHVCGHVYRHVCGHVCGHATSRFQPCLCDISHFMAWLKTFESPPHAHGSTRSRAQRDGGWPFSVWRAVQDTSLSVHAKASSDRREKNNAAPRLRRRRP